MIPDLNKKYRHENYDVNLCKVINSVLSVEFPFNTLNCVYIGYDEYNKPKFEVSIIGDHLDDQAIIALTKAKACEILPLVGVVGAKPIVIIKEG